MKQRDQDRIRQALTEKRGELTARLERISQNVRRKLDPDSAERAKQLEDSEVVDALGNDAREELAEIAATLSRMDGGDWGICRACGEPIDDARLAAYPYATRCMACNGNAR